MFCSKSSLHWALRSKSNDCLIMLFAALLCSIGLCVGTTYCKDPVPHSLLARVKFLACGLWDMRFVTKHNADSTADWRKFLHHVRSLDDGKQVN